MITKTEILIPYAPQVIIKPGTIYAPENESVLITGNSGSGKSSLLHMLFESERINRQRGYKRTDQLNTQLPNFIQCYSPLLKMEELTDDQDFNEYIGAKYDNSVSEGHHESITEELGESASEEEINARVQKEAKKIIKKNVKGFLEHLNVKKFTNTFDPEKPLDEQYISSLALKYSKHIEIPEMAFATFVYQITQYVETLNPNMNQNDLPFLQVAEEYPDVINLLAKEYKVSPNKLYSVCALLDHNILGAFDTTFSEWLFMKNEGEKNHIFARYNIPGQKTKRTSILTLKGKEETLKAITGSSGQQDKHYMDELFKGENNVILLDEPMANLDENSQDVYSSKIFDQSKKSQLWVVSHDRYFNKQAREKGWYEINLG